MGQGLDKILRSFDPNGFAGSNQGVAGVNQGFQGSAVGQGVGSQLGLQRTALSPRPGEPNGPQNGNPYADMLKRVASAFFPTAAATPPSSAPPRQPGPTSGGGVPTAGGGTTPFGPAPARPPGSTGTAPGIARGGYMPTLPQRGSNEYGFRGGPAVISQVANRPPGGP